jgi:ribosomal protein S10
MEIDKRDLVRYGGTGLLTAVILLALVGSGWALIRGKSPVEGALENVRRMPLIGLVMADNSGVESSMRKAIEDESRSPTQDGLSRPSSLIADLRRQYIVPALRAADDATAVAAVAARAELAHHLRRTDTAACRAFSVGTLQRPDSLDSEGRRLFAQWQQAVETAYRSGKAAGQPQPLPTRPELVTLLQQAGFSQADFYRLNAFRNLSNEASCDIELKVDSVPPLLAADKRGPFARYMLTN